MIGFGMILLILAAMPRPALCAEVCPSLTNESGFKSDEVIKGGVEITTDGSSKPVSQAQITVRCIQNGNVMAWVDIECSTRTSFTGVAGVGAEKTEANDPARFKPLA
jgi:hypothetical protein